MEKNCFSDRCCRKRPDVRSLTVARCGRTENVTIKQDLLITYVLQYKLRDLCFINDSRSNCCPSKGGLKQLVRVPIGVWRYPVKNRIRTEHNIVFRLSIMLGHTRNWSKQ